MLIALLPFVLVLSLAVTKIKGGGLGFLSSPQTSSYHPSSDHSQYDELLSSSSSSSSTHPSRNIPTSSTPPMSCDDMDIDVFEPLRIPCEINGFTIPAIIDTGAQITVMSAACAKRCGIAGLIDDRFPGKAIGVGSSDILGRIDELSMRVGPLSYHNRVAILRESRVDLIIGLDFLRRFKAEINLDQRLMKLRVREKTIRMPFITSENSQLKTFMDASNYKENSEVDDEYESSSLSPSPSSHHNRDRLQRVTNPNSLHKQTSSSPSSPTSSVSYKRDIDNGRNRHESNSMSSFSSRSKPTSASSLSLPMPDYGDEVDDDLDTDSNRVTMEGI